MKTHSKFPSKLVFCFVLLELSQVFGCFSLPLRGTKTKKIQKMLFLLSETSYQKQVRARSDFQAIHPGLSVFKIIPSMVSTFLLAPPLVA